MPAVLLATVTEGVFTANATS